MNQKWDAEKYGADFSFVHQYGNGVLDLIDADKGSTVLDLGCGNGALTKTLQEKGYAIKGMDESRELLDIARKNYPDIEFIHGDAACFECPEPFDVIFSNAVFHWIDREHQANMLTCIHDALKKDGQLVFEFGGYGNNGLIHGALRRIFSEHGYGYDVPFFFPTISEYATLLENNGFRVTYAVLFKRPTRLKGEYGLRDWINMFVGTQFSPVASDHEREEILDQAEDALRSELYKDGTWYADYVRLRMKAIRL